MNGILFFATWSCFTGLFVATGYFSLLGAAVTAYVALIAILITTK